MPFGPLPLDAVATPRGLSEPSEFTRYCEIVPGPGGGELASAPKLPTYAYLSCGSSVMVAGFGPVGTLAGVKGANWPSRPIAYCATVLEAMFTVYAYRLW